MHGARDGRLLRRRGGADLHQTSCKAPLATDACAWEFYRQAKWRLRISAEGYCCLLQHPEGIFRLHIFHMEWLGHLPQPARGHQWENGQTCIELGMYCKQIDEQLCHASSRYAWSGQQSISMHGSKHRTLSWLLLMLPIRTTNMHPVSALLCILPLMTC